MTEEKFPENTIVIKSFTYYSTENKVQKIQNVLIGFVFYFLTDGMQFPAQHQIGNDAQTDEQAKQCRRIDPVLGLVHRHLLQELLWTPVVAVDLRAAQFLSAHAVDGDHRPLKAVPHVTDVGQPLQILGNDVEVDEEAGEQDDRNGGHRTEEDASLHAHPGADQQPQALRNQRRQDAD